MKRSILELARVIRSKNSGPYELTLDILFKDRESFELLRSKGIVNEKLISRLYQVPKEDILGILWFKPA